VLELVHLTVVAGRRGKCFWLDANEKQNSRT
jgi:hypothetical protein